VEEDAKLAEAAEKFGQDWVAVATLVPGRSNQQCRHRWLTTTSSLHPTDRETPVSHKGKWTAEEDAKLAKAAEKFGQDWVAVATLVPGRTNQQVRYRFFTSLYGTITGSKRRWTQEEDTKLIDAVGHYGEDWGEVAAMIPGRTNLQCRARWLSSFDPVTTDDGTEGGNKGKWTPEEDANLTEAVEKLGKNWVAVAALIPGRTNKKCRFRWFNRPESNEGKEIPGEDKVDVEESSGKSRMCSTKCLAIDEGHERRHGHSSDRQSNGGLQQANDTAAPLHSFSLN
jgi:myb proto-oncogene protein